MRPSPIDQAIEAMRREGRDIDPELEAMLRKAYGEPPAPSFRDAGWRPPERPTEPVEREPGEDDE